MLKVILWKCCIRLPNLRSRWDRYRVQSFSKGAAKPRGEWGGDAFALKNNDSASYAGYHLPWANI